MVAAYHPVNAFIVFAPLGIVAWRGRAFVPAPLGTARTVGPVVAKPAEL